MNLYQPVLAGYQGLVAQRIKRTFNFAGISLDASDTQHTGQSCAGIFKGPNPTVSESLTLTPVTCSVSVNIWFVQLSEDHFSAADRSARDRHSTNVSQGQQ